MKHKHAVYNWLKERKICRLKTICPTPGSNIGMKQVNGECTCIFNTIEPTNLDRFWKKKPTMQASAKEGIC